MINVLSSLTKNLLSNLITAKVHGCVAPPNFASSVLMVVDALRKHPYFMKIVKNLGGVCFLAE